MKRLLALLLLLLLAACGGAGPDTSSPATPEHILHLPPTIDGHGPRRTGFGRKFRRGLWNRSLSDFDHMVPAVQANYGPYILVLIDLPITSRRLVGVIFHQPGTVQRALRYFASNDSQFWGMLDLPLVNLAAAVYASRDGVHYGCAPVKGAIFRPSIECIWTDRRTSAAMVLTRGDLPSPQTLLATMEQVHQDSTSGPVGPCSFPSCGLPESTAPEPTVAPQPTLTVPSRLPTLPTVPSSLPVTTVPSSLPVTTVP